MVSWNDSYLLGVEEIDNQHMNLFKHLSSIEKQKKEDGAYSCLHVLFFMYHYAVDHFSSEEKLMDAVNYPDAEHHKAEHESFRMAALEFHKDVKDPETICNVLAYIKQWIVTHIAVTDQLLGTYIRQSTLASLGEVAGPGRLTSSSHASVVLPHPPEPHIKFDSPAGNQK